MNRVAVVIPYFQREPGILRRALTSIVEQQLGADTVLDVIIVDDQSPAPPEPEFDGLGLAERHGIRVIRRPNGGPGEARNTGLDAVSADTDYVAFLDSDDMWGSQHLGTAVACLRTGCQFFFADHDHMSEDGASWFRCLATWSVDPPAADAQPVMGIEGAFRMPARSAFKYIVREYIAHTSTVVFDFRRFEKLRFDKALRFAGEDYFFFMSIVANSEAVAFSAETTVFRGRGISMYASHYDWDSPGCVVRYVNLLALYLKVGESFSLEEGEARVNRNFVGLYRRAIIYLLMRNAIRHAWKNLALIWRIAGIDKRFWYSFPRNFYTVLSQKLTNRLEMPIG